MTWFALRLRRAGIERTTADRLLGLNNHDPIASAVYVPRINLGGDLAAMIPGYVLAEVDPKALTEARKIRGVVGVAGAVTDEEIDKLRVIEEHGVDVATLYEPGSIVHIAKGPLAGQRGTFIRSINRWCLIVSIKAFGRELAVRVDYAASQKIMRAAMSDRITTRRRTCSPNEIS